MNTNRQKLDTTRNVMNYSVQLEVPISYSIFLLILFYLDSKVKLANQAISDLQEKCHSLNKAVEVFDKKNQALMDLLSEIKHKNIYLEQLISDLKTDNAASLDTIAKIENSTYSMYIPTIDPTLSKLILGLVCIGVVTYGSFTLINFISTHFANSSIGLLIRGLDKKLTWLGEKCGIMDTPVNDQIFLDSFNNNFKVSLEKDIVTRIFIDSNGKFTPIGEYLNSLMTTVAASQTTIDLLRTDISNYENIVSHLRIQLAEQGARVGAIASDATGNVVADLGQNAAVLDNAVIVANLLNNVPL